MRETQLLLLAAFCAAVQVAGRRTAQFGALKHPFVSSGVARRPANCRLGDRSTDVDRCIKQLLDESRPTVAKKADPLRVRFYKRGNWELSNIMVYGLSGYSVDKVSVSFLSDDRIAVRATISWSHISGRLDAKYKRCINLLFTKPCATLRAKPYITVRKTVGTLTTTLNLDVSQSGRVTVTPSGTAVSLSLARIDVEANPQGVVGAINSILKIIGDPASWVATWLSNDWWKDNKHEIEEDVKKALDDAVKEKVPVSLSRLLEL